MRLSISTIALTVLCAVPATLSAAVPGAPVEKAVRPSIFAAAAARSIDLTKVPAWEAVPELNLTPIVPGDGLPTLKELGLTWADIVKLPEPESDSEKLATRQFTAHCKDWDMMFESDEGLWCYNYLNGLGSTSCTVPATGSIRMCWAALGGSWHGRSSSGTSQTVTCSNVAGGGSWVLNNCRDYSSGYYFGKTCQGENTAWGNGQLIVHVGENY